MLAALLCSAPACGLSHCMAVAFAWSWRRLSRSAPGGGEVVVRPSVPAASPSARGGKRRDPCGGLPSCRRVSCVTALSADVACTVRRHAHSAHGVHRPGTQTHYLTHTVTGAWTRAAHSDSSRHTELSATQCAQYTVTNQHARARARAASLPQHHAAWTTGGGTPRVGVARVSAAQRRAGACSCRRAQGFRVAGYINGC